MIGWLLAASAQAGTVGVGIGSSLDLPDPNESLLRTAFLPTVDLVVPYWMDLAPGAALRIRGHGVLGVGHDVMAWKMPLVGEEAKTFETYLTQLGVSVGPEIRLQRAIEDPKAPGAGLRYPLVGPYLAGDLGVTMVNNWHTDMSRPELFSPNSYDSDALDNSYAISPYTVQFAPETSLELGLHAKRLWTEVGYEMMFLPSSKLVRGTTGLGLYRAAYGWNAVRLEIGTTLGGGSTD